LSGLARAVGAGAAGAIKPACKAGSRCSCQRGSSPSPTGGLRGSLALCCVPCLTHENDDVFVKVVKLMLREGAGAWEGGA
jgi:hypothetical protein